MNLFEMLKILDDNGHWFTVQCEGKRKFYSISIMPPRGSKKFIHNKDIKVVEKALQVMWGHLFTHDIPKEHEGKSVVIASMPLPTPMPVPG